jgi:hypothetical protein
LKWIKQNNYWTKSECGKYTITKPGRPELYPKPYGLWRLEPKTLIGCYPTFEDASRAQPGMTDAKGRQT